MSTSLTALPDPKLDPFGGLTGGVSALDIKIDMNMCIALVGPLKSGKSWLAATAPGTIQFYDTDNRAESLAGKPNIRITTLVDQDQKNPVIVNSIEADLAVMKYRKKMGQPIPQWVVFDSMSTLEVGIKNSYMNVAGGDSYRILRISSITSLRHAQGWDVINGMKAYMRYFISEFRALMNVIVVFHERDEKDAAASTAQKVAYTGKTVINPQYLEDMLIQFNDVWRVDLSAGSNRFQVQVDADYNFRACNSLGLKGLQEPNIAQMIEASKSKNLVTK